MNIALIAHDNKKELMVQFCTAYCGILAQHTLCATATTGLQISEATGLRIHRFLSFDHGGGQQIAAVSPIMRSTWCCASATPIRRPRMRM